MSEDIFGDEEKFPGIEQAPLEEERADVVPELKETPSEHQSDPLLIYFKKSVRMSC